MKYLLAFILIFLPFVYSPWTSPVFEVPKVWLYLRSVEVFVVLGIIRSTTLKKQQLNIHLLILTLGFVVWATIASSLGSNFIKSWWGSYYRDDGLFTLYHHFAFAVTIGLYAQKSWLSVIKKSIVFSSLGLSIWIFVNIAIHQSIPQSLPFGHPAFIAMYLALTLPLLPVITLPLAFMAILSTKTLTGLFGIGIFLLIKQFAWKKVPFKKQLFAFFFISILFGSLTLVLRDSPRSSFDNRNRIIAHSVLATLQKPLTGWGWSNFDYAFEAVNWPIYFRFDIRYDKPHSTLLEVMTTTGIVGLTLYLLMQYLMLTNISSHYFDPALAQVYVMFLLLSQTNIYSVNVEIIYWLVVGITIACVFRARSGPGLPQMEKNKSR